MNQWAIGSWAIMWYKKITKLKEQMTHWDMLTQSHQIWILTCPSASFPRQFDDFVPFDRSGYGVLFVWCSLLFCPPTTGRVWKDTRQLKQPRRRRQQKPHKFAYLTMKNSIFARFARAVFIFCHFVDVLVLSTSWNDLFCNCVDDVSIWWQMFNFVFLCPKRWFQFNHRIVRTHFSSIMGLINWKIIAETRSHIFRWRSRFRRRRVCLSSLLSGSLSFGLGSPICALL